MNFVDRLSKDKLAIFLFHGIVARSDYNVRNYTNKHLEKDCFYKLIKALAGAGHPLSMDEVVECYRAGGESFPPYSFAVTFDDGFENNYSIAAPILKDLNVPATFYVTTDFIENNHMSWIDRVEYCLENTPEGKLVFSWDQLIHTFQNREDKIRVLNFLRNSIKKDATVNLDDLVRSIYSQCGSDAIEQSSDPLDLKMNWEQVGELNDDENFIVGGHSHSHATLSFLQETDLEYEINTSIELLEKKAGIQARHYSYPEGLPHCYSDNVIEALMKRNIVCSPTAEDGMNSVSDSLFHLKRIMVV